MQLLEVMLTRALPVHDVRAGSADGSVGGIGDGVDRVARVVGTVAGIVGGVVVGGGVASGVAGVGGRFHGVGSEGSAVLRAGLSTDPRFRGLDRLPGHVLLRGDEVQDAPSTLTGTPHRRTVVDVHQPLQQRTHVLLHTSPPVHADHHILQQPTDPCHALRPLRHSASRGVGPVEAQRGGVQRAARPSIGGRSADGSRPRRVVWSAPSGSPTGRPGRSSSAVVRRRSHRSSERTRRS